MKVPTENNVTEANLVIKCKGLKTFFHFHVFIWHLSLETLSGCSPFPF